MKSRTRLFKQLNTQGAYAAPFLLGHFHMALYGQIPKPFSVTFGFAKKTLP